MSIPSTLFALTILFFAGAGFGPHSAVAQDGLTGSTLDASSQKQLIGTDENGNGVRDAVDRYIEEHISSGGARQAVESYARTMTMLMLSSEKPEHARSMIRTKMRKATCIELRFGPKVAKRLGRVGELILNSAARSKSYIEASEYGDNAKPLRGRHRTAMCTA